VKEDMPLVRRKEIPTSGVFVAPEENSSKTITGRGTIYKKVDKKEELKSSLSKKESKLTEQDCDKFIKASSMVTMGESFQNPVTGRMMKKGSAAFFSYLRDCDTKMPVEVVKERRLATDKDVQRFGKRKIYDCKDYDVASSSKFNPNPHQIKARNRFKQILEDPPIKDLRGLLLYYGLGTGKTCTYAMIADLYHRMYPDNPIFVFTPGSLRTNFLEQYCSFCGRDKLMVPNNFVFITINDSSVLGKLPKNFDNSLVIIDEVHKLTHAKANESPILSNIYDLVEKANNMYIVTGSGTPMETNIEELYYLGNLHIKNLFEMESTFKKMFKWDKDRQTYLLNPKDEAEFKKLFSSFISHYDPQGKLEASGSSAFPTVIKEDVYVPINPDREQDYVFIVQAENQRMKPPGEDLKYRDYEKYKRMKQAYYIAISRLVSSQVANFKYPMLNVEEFKDVEKIKKKKYKDDKEGKEEEGKEEEGKEEEGKEEQEDVALEVEEGVDKLNEEVVGSAQVIGIPDLLKGQGGWVTKETLQNLDNNGEKILEIIEDIKETPGKHAIYTRFKTHFGSRLLGTLLDLEGIPYVYFDGDMNDRERVKVLEKFNSPQNIHGEKVKVIILTSAGSAGINLKEIRRFHILEQYFNLAYMGQVIGRGIRYLSHERLDPKDRDITIRNYFLELSTPEQTKNFSSDVLAYQSGLLKDKSISYVRNLIKQFDI
jgi:superfamily II DNA or RNA helicase